MQLLPEEQRVCVLHHTPQPLGPAVRMSLKMSGEQWTSGAQVQEKQRAVGNPGTFLKGHSHRSTHHGDQRTGSSLKSTYKVPGDTFNNLEASAGGTGA